jgi:hypothetical protein
MGEPCYTESRKSEKEGWGLLSLSQLTGKGKIQIRRQQNLGHLPTVCITY